MTSSFYEMNPSNTTQHERYSNNHYSAEKNNINTSIKSVNVKYVIKKDEYRVSTDKSRKKEKIRKANLKLRMAGI